jgi:hypothetical protein
VKAYTTERVIVHNDESPVFGKNRVTIRIGDQGAGPYIVVRGDNQEPDHDETPHDFFLQSEEEIDYFAAECKALLRQAGKE